MSGTYFRDTYATLELLSHRINNQTISYEETEARDACQVLCQCVVDDFEEREDECEDDDE